MPSIWIWGRNEIDRDLCRFLHNEFINSESIQLREEEDQDWFKEKVERLEVSRSNDEISGWERYQIVKDRIDFQPEDACFPTSKRKWISKDFLKEQFWFGKNEKNSEKNFSEIFFHFFFGTKSLSEILSNRGGKY